MTESYFQSRQREELAACRSRFERAQQKLTTHDEYVRYERKHPGRIQSFMDCAAEQLDKAEQLIDAMEGPAQKAHWLHFRTTLQLIKIYMIIVKADLEHSEVSSKYSEEISELGEVISELEHIKQQPLKALAKANETRSTKAKLDHANWQVWADHVWQENPHWNKDGVATQIIEDHNIKAKPGTVADVIRPQSSRSPARSTSPSG